jgi:hypothetical protein
VRVHPIHTSSPHIPTAAQTRRGPTPSTRRARLLPSASVANGARALHPVRASEPGARLPSGRRLPSTRGPLRRRPRRRPPPARVRRPADPRAEAARQGPGRMGGGRLLRDAGRAALRQHQGHQGRLPEARAPGARRLSPPSRASGFTPSIGLFVRCLPSFTLWNGVMTHGSRTVSSFCLYILWILNAPICVNNLDVTLQ